MIFANPIGKTLSACALGILAVVGMTLTVSSAQASEINPGTAIPGVTGPITNGSTTDVQATSTTINILYLGHDAADTDTLTLAGSTPGGTVITNNSTTQGSVHTLGVSLGNLVFTLNDTSQGTSYVSATAYTNSNGYSPVYHFADFTLADETAYDAVFTNANVQMTSSENTYILANGGYSDWTFVGVEDLAAVGSDDWNDLVFAVQDVPVPEPASLVLFGSALVGFALIRRRRYLGLKKSA